MKTNLLTLVLIAIVSFSCKPAERIVTNTKTEYVKQVEYDSIYVKQWDSVYVERAGDTLRLERFKTVFKDRLKLQKDTVCRTDTLTVLIPGPDKVQLQEVRGFFWWTGLLGIIALVGWLVFKFSNFQIFKSLKP